MSFLYHRVPENMQGTILYPLNELKSIYPDVYQTEVQKYEGREHIPTQTVFFLNCLWNDVLHLSALHPSEITKAYATLGYEKKTTSYFEIDPHTFEPEKTVVYLYSPRTKGVQPPENDFVPYNPDAIEQYARFPQETLAYYKEMLSARKKPLLWHRVPHILYKGAIDTKNLPSISV